MRLISLKVTLFFMCFLSVFVKAQGIYAQNIPAETVIPPSCDIIPPNDGNYQFSQLHASHFKLNELTEIPEVKKTWQVLCNTPVSLFLKIVDNRHDSSRLDNESYFGLGHVNRQGKIGNYQLTLSHASVDNERADMFLSENMSASKASSMTVKKNKTYGWLLGENTPASGKVFSVDITVSAKLNSLKETDGPIVNGAELDGNAELIFSFGI
ncbi:hypothetical protein [Providencia stuartii]|uniref:hypothetical protein n=1 Tax=Providencia stuartii TaxID=588 RepID=UPI0018C6384D|nr:hypothetical protein [Providencia stuartii]MBG5919087.1 hypothetical protein [Providencia stuartii]